MEQKNRNYTVKEAAKEVGVSESRIRQLALANAIDYSYFGNMLVISQAGVDQAKTRKTKPGPAASKKAA